MSTEVFEANQNQFKKSFGYTQNGKEIFIHSISNKNGIELTVCDWGATITSLKIPINDLEKIDVVLGFDNAESYEQSFINKNAPFFGAVVGLIAGRINNGKVNINGNTIQLDTNFGKHHLHGGHQNLSNQLWNLKEITTGENQSLSYEITTTKNQSNYPASVTVIAKYQLLENNSLKVTFTATATEDTPINLTQHSYFNLNGHENSIEDLQLKVTATTFLETDAEMIPTGKFLPVKNTPFDFLEYKACPVSIDTSFVLSDNNAASLYSPKNKLVMNVSTSQPSVHIYVGGKCNDNLKTKNNTPYHHLSGICFETQNFPDAPNRPEFPNAILKKGGTYQSETIFHFERKEH